MSDPLIPEPESESLSESVFKAIQGIKKDFGKYSDEEIYTCLKGCNMDPVETTQTLQYFETFQEVKKKERKVVSAYKNRRRGPRDDDRYSNYEGERHYNARQENGPRFHQRRGKENGSEKNGSQPRGGPRAHTKESKKDAFQENGSEKNAKAPKNESIVPPAASSKVEESTSLPATTKNPTSAKNKVAESTSRSATTKNPLPVQSNLDKKRPGTQINVSSGSKTGPGPTPASTPTDTTPSVPRQQPGKSSLGNSVGPLSSPSPSDPVSLVPPRNNHGAIQRETTRNQKVVSFSGRTPSVVFPDRVLAPEDFKSNILFGTLDTYLEKSSETEAAPKNEPQPEPQVPVTSQENADLMFNPPKQEVLPPVSRSQQDSLLAPMSSEPSQQGEKMMPPPRAQNAQNSGATFSPFLQNSYSGQIFPYYSPMYMPQVPQNVVHPVLSHGGYANQQLLTGVAGAKYPYVRPREENKEENVFYNLAQAYPPPAAAAAAQGGHGFPSVFHQSQMVPQSRQQQMGGETAPLTSYPRSQMQYGGPYWNPNREN